MVWRWTPSKGSVWKLHLRLHLENKADWSANTESFNGRTEQAQFPEEAGPFNISSRGNAWGWGGGCMRKAGFVMDTEWESLSSTVKRGTLSKLLSVICHFTSIFLILITVFALSMVQRNLQKWSTTLLLFIDIQNTFIFLYVLRSDLWAACGVWEGFRHWEGGLNFLNCVLQVHYTLDQNDSMECSVVISHRAQESSMCCCLAHCASRMVWTKQTWSFVDFGFASVEAKQVSADRPALFFHTTPVNLWEVVGLPTLVNVAVSPSKVTLELFTFHRSWFTFTEQVLGVWAICVSLCP